MTARWGGRAKRARQRRRLGQETGRRVDPQGTGRPTYGIDFAVSSGRRADILPYTAVDGSAAVARYEDKKRSHLDTEKKWTDAGLSFAPFVIEAHGGGHGAEARRVLGFMAGATAASQGGDAGFHAASARNCQGSGEEAW